MQRKIPALFKLMGGSKFAQNRVKYKYYDAQKVFVEIRIEMSFCVKHLFYFSSKESISKRMNQLEFDIILWVALLGVKFSIMFIQIFSIVFRIYFYDEKRVFA